MIFTLLAIMFTLIFIGLMFMLSGRIQDSQLDKQILERKKKEEELKKTTTDPSKVFGKEWKEGVPRPRVCPCCGTFLERHEYLYASMTKSQDNAKNYVHIYGCKYCYMNLEKNESIESVDF
jgi:hypothetical protein